MDITVGTSPAQKLRLVPRAGAGVTITEVDLGIDLDDELPCTCSDHFPDDDFETIPAYLLSGAHVGTTITIPEHDGVTVTLIADRIEHVDSAVYITDNDDPDSPIVLRRSVDVIVPAAEDLDLEAVDNFFLDAA